MSQSWHSLVVLAGALLPASLLAGSVHAQSGEEIMDRAVERYEERVEDIRAYEVTQEVALAGTVVTNRFEKRTVDGRTVFVPADGAEGEGPQGWGDPYAFLREMAGRAELRGRETLAGRDVWTLSVDDFGGVDTDRMTPAGARGEFRPRSATVQVDTDTHVLRRLAIEGHMVADGDENPIEMTARFEDYRDRDGMLYPFRTRVSIEGMDAVMSERDRQRARRQLELLRARLDSLDEQERARVEERVRPQLERLEAAMESGRVDVTVVVRELTVNPASDAG